MKYHTHLYYLLSALLLCSLGAPLAYASEAPPPPRIVYTITGVNETLTNNIQHRLADAEPNATNLNAHLLNHYLEIIPHEVTEALSPFGFFTPTTHATLEQSGEQYVISIHVTPGKRTYYNTITITILGEGKTDPAFIQLIDNFPIQTGDSFDSAEYEQARQNLFTLAHDKGYRLGKLVTSQVDVNRNTQRANIIIVFDTGPRFKLGVVRFHQAIFSEYFLRRFIRFNYGTPYSTEALVTLQNNLGNSGFFQSVVLDPAEADSEALDVPIDIYLTPRKKHQFLIGAGYGTDTQARVSLGWDIRRVTDTGHHIANVLRASRREAFWQSSYIIPGRNPVTDRYGISVGYEKSTAGVGERATKQIALSYNTLWRNWQQILALHFQHERWRESSADLFENSQLLMPSITWIKQVKSDVASLGKGYRLALDFRGGAESILSSTSFGQMNLQGEVLLTPTKNIRLLSRAELGATAVETFDHLPLSRQFKAGGYNSIRGYSYDSIGPGKYLIVASIEPQYRLFGNVFGTVFMDAGSTFVDRFRLKRGVGGGIVYVSPIGAFSFVLATGLDNDKRKVHVHIGMGPDI